MREEAIRYTHHGGGAFLFSAPADGSPDTEAEAASPHFGGSVRGIFAARKAAVRLIVSPRRRVGALARIRGHADYESRFEGRWGMDDVIMVEWAVMDTPSWAAGEFILGPNVRLTTAAIMTLSPRAWLKTCCGLRVTNEPSLCRQ